MHQDREPLLSTAPSIQEMEDGFEIKKHDHFADLDSNKGGMTRRYQDDDTSAASTCFKKCFALKGHMYTCMCLPFACCGGGPVVQVKEGHRAAVLRYGKLYKIVNPGTYHINVGVEKFTIKSVQIQTLLIPAQRVMTQDNVSVVLDAVCFYRIMDLEKAIFNVADCDKATRNLAQSTLETLLGERTLDGLLSNRAAIADRVTELLDEQTKHWGIHVQALEIRDIRIPDSMQRVMAAVAEASREGQANVVIAKAELEASETFAKAADIMSRNPVALQLRYFQTLAEISAEKNSTIIVPSEVTGMFRPLAAWNHSEAFAGNIPKEVFEALKEVAVERVEAKKMHGDLASSARVASED